MAADYKLIIFDWDGTLMDSAGHIVSNMLQAIDALGLPRREPEQLSELIGLGLKDAFTRLFPEIDVRETLALMQRYRQSYVQSTKDSSELFDGTRASLDQLREAGYTLAVATGKSRAGLTRALGDSGLEEYFHMTRCADESADKPHPQMLFDILQTTSFDPRSALMVGDTEYDMHMAGNADMHALGVDCGVHSNERLQESGALAVLPSVSALPEWLKQHTL